MYRFMYLQYVINRGKTQWTCSSTEYTDFLLFLRQLVNPGNCLVCHFILITVEKI